MASKKTYPVALATGIARFDFLADALDRDSRKIFGSVFDKILGFFSDHGVKVVTDGLHYFRGIKSFLDDDGFSTHHTRVGFASRLAERSADLKAQVEGILKATGAAKVHVIGHSMGGLDARAMIARLGMADKVASLTTIGTPHHGTSFADYKLNRGGDKLIDAVANAIDFRGFGDLTRDACKKFNDEVRDAEAANGVHYQTYTASEGRDATFIFLQPSWDIIFKEEGENDGLVPVTSQIWTAELVSSDGKSRKKVVQKWFADSSGKAVPADHLNEVGWWDLNELHDVKIMKEAGSRDKYEKKVKEIYRDIARDLRERFPL
ncbi:MAG TPA: alpha/beta fold hydrolase [Pyrinomonadaceae bacterium]|jgi:triacylglycerol lipase|nr:alpha/beta fold hydrolase [Pyrinomonadaceae bacterium]